MRLSFRFALLAGLVLALAVGSLPALAVDPPSIKVNPVWRPAVTLDSVDAAPVGSFNPGDDFRYVDAEIYVTSSVKFWSVQLTCTVNKLALTSYEIADTGNADPGDDVEPVRWGPEVGTLNNNFTAVVEPFSPATGGRRITAARFWDPLGGNGYARNFLLATLRYRALDLAANAVSPFTCTSSFLNKDGKVVLAAVYTAPPPLPVITGYTISARATYQGRVSPAGIGMQCDGPDGDDLPDFVLSSATGSFTYNALRQQGWFSCQYFGNVTNAAAGYQPDSYILGFTWTNLMGSSYQFLPVELHGGNVSRNDASTDADPATADEVVDSADLGVITAPANWEKPGAAGDINGDARTDRADLTIAAGNFGEREWTMYQHAIYSLPRNWDATRNSRVWLAGNWWTGQVSQLVAGNNKDFWATLSPDGSRIAFARAVNPDPNCPQCQLALFVAPVSPLGVVGAPVRLTPATNWYDKNVAPSWSPDGTRLAFVCTWWDEDRSGAGVNDGDLCVVDASGRNLRTVAFRTHIYPPTWYVNNWGETYLVYGGSQFNDTCADTLCRKDPLQPEWIPPVVLDPDIPSGGSNVSDMPRICMMEGCNRLFYRYNNGSTRVLRWADINLDTNDVPAFETRAAAAAPFHMAVDYDLDGDGPGTAYGLPSTNVDWYTVSQVNFLISYYEPANSYEFRNMDLNWPAIVGDKFEWFAPYVHGVYDMVGNPDPPAPGTPDEIYYMMRNTAEYVP